MSRITISLPDELHRALKESAARRGTTIGELVAESLEFYGIKSTDEARRIVELARRNASLPADEAQELAVAETRSERA